MICPSTNDSLAVGTPRLSGNPVGQATCYEPLTGQIVVDWSEIDVGRLVTAVRDHGLMPWLHLVIHSTGGNTRMSPSDLETLQVEFDSNSKQQRNRRDQLSEVDAHLRRQGIEYVLLKEYAFDGTFPAPGCVQQGDLDLLVHSRDVTSAIASLESLGYRRVPRPWANEYRFKRSDGACVDLQDSFNPALGWWAELEAQPESMFLRARLLRVDSAEIPVLHPLDNARFLIAHAAMHHNFTPFSKIVNTWNYLVRQRDQIDDELLWDCFCAARLGKLYACAAWYIEQLVGRPFPLTITRHGDLTRTELWFRELMPSPHAYFSTDVATRLAQRWRDGWQLMCFLDTRSQQVACLWHIVQARIRQRFAPRIHS